jgi:outer membrane lipoprotein-sorting protein
MRILVFTIVFILTTARVWGDDALEISRRLDELFRSGSSRAIVSMQVTTPHYSRSLKMEIYSRGMDDTLVRILKPAKERGVATLKRGSEMWNYLPKIKKTIRIPPSMMSASWMGSDFTNDDLVRESSWETDYDVTLLAGQPAGQAALAYVPKPEAPVPWQKVVGYFDAETLIPTAIEYFDEKGRKARTMTFDEVGVLGGRTLPKRIVLTPLLGDKRGHSTVMVYEEAEFDIPLKEGLFSLTTLRHGR